MKSYSRRKHTRFIWLFYITAFLFLFLFYRLIVLHACEHEKFSQLAKLQHTGEIKIDALRGTIYDRNGVSLAFSVTLPSIAANPSQIQDMEKTAAALADAIGKPRKEMLEILRGHKTFVWVARKIDASIAKQVESMNLPGVFVVEENTGKRFHPKNKTACHILGYTGIDDQGLEGIEARFEDLLSGKQGVLQAEMDQRGRILPGGDTKYVPPVPGKDIYLTIDETVQFIVEKELEKTVKKYHAAGGTVIVYNPKNGDILALANYPNYSPSSGSLAPKSAVRNSAICDSYEPGSTFKVIMAASALDSGSITPTDQFYCGQSLDVGGYSLRNADDGLNSPSGRENIEGIITYSFNVGSAAVGLKMGSKTFYKYIDAFGFGKLTGVDLPGETEGILTPGQYWKPINLATISYGQGIAVTPIQLVQALGTIANDGVMMKPRIIRKFADHEKGTPLYNEPRSAGRILKPQTSHEMLKILTNVCENGTGKKARIPGYTIGGKTGTANVVENGVYVSNKYIASFMGVIPVEDPQLVILVKIQDPKGIIWGGSVAAPLFKQIGSQIVWRQGIKPTKPVTSIELEDENSQKKNGD